MPFIKILAVRFDYLDYPKDNKVHAHPTPLLGGVGIFAAFLIAILASSQAISSSHVKAMLTGAFILLAIGLIDDKMGMIAEAARTVTLLFMKYNGNWRYVEPYSYRFKGEGRLFYGFCMKDQHIESFRLEKIEDLQNTEMPYAPRWPVEIGMG